MSKYRREIDMQCCNQWMNGIRTINGQYPDDNRDFDINAGTGIIIQPTTGGITIINDVQVPANALKYKGTVGTGGTIASLPAADPDNQGDTYIAVSAATSPVTYDTGDVLISDGSAWSVIPSGNDIVPIVTAWQTPPDDTDVPSEKLVKDSLDTKVTGPASAVDEQIAVFDGTSGKLIKDSGLTTDSFLPITGGTLQGSLMLTGTNGITSNNIIFGDWKLATGRPASGKLHHYIGLDNNTGVGWIKTRAEADVITDLGIDLKAPIDSPVFTGAVTVAQRILFNNTSNPYVSMATSGNIYYIQGFGGDLYLGTGLSASLKIDSTGLATFPSGKTPMVGSDNVGVNTTGAIIGKIKSRIFNQPTTGASPTFRYRNDDGTSTTITTTAQTLTVEGQQFTVKLQNYHTLIGSGSYRLQSVEVSVTLNETTYVWNELGTYAD